MQTPLYQIVDWNNHFETFRSRVVDKCMYVHIPNKPGGLGLKNVLGVGDGPAIYGLWMLIVQLCSRQRSKRDGWLTQDGTKDGRPLSAMELSRAFGRPLDEIYRVFEVLTAPHIGWIRLVRGEPEYERLAEEASSEHRPDNATIPSEHRPSIVDSSSEHRPSTSANRVKPQIGQLSPHHLLNGIDLASFAHRRRIARPSIKEGRNKSTTVPSITVPTTTPPETATVTQGDSKKITEEERLQWSETKTKINKLFPNSEAWTYEEERLLSDLLPMKPESLRLIVWAHSLPTDHRFHDLTKLKQSRLALLREFGSEVDKIRNVRKQLGLNADPKPIIRITA